MVLVFNLVVVGQYFVVTESCLPVEVDRRHVGMEHVQEDHSRERIFVNYIVLQKVFQEYCGDASPPVLFRDGQTEDVDNIELGVLVIDEP